MDVSIQDLIVIIGSKEVELIVARNTITQLQAAVKTLQEKVAAEQKSE